MVRQDPILIAAPPRSGTTMMAGLLHKHGVWVGNARTTRYPGTNSDFGSENTDIKNIMKKEAQKIGYKNWTTPFPDPDLDLDIKVGIEHFVPDDQAWLVKTSWCLVFWKFWTSAYPDARWIFLTRDTVKIVDSMNRHPGMKKHPDGQKNQYIAHLLRNASDIIDHGAWFTCVDIEAVADRDMGVIADLFDFLDMTPDQSIIDEWLVPDMLKR